jgi:Ran-binding protein 3
VEAARKYEEMKGALKRKYDEVEIITGEEDEENIVEINCKLFTFENMNYEERGRGMLRLNDKKSGSRLVFRASGSLRVLLNTKVWGDQTCEKASPKSLRLTAFNSEGQLKIYIVQGRSEDIESLHHELQRRIKREQVREEESKPQTESTDEPVNKKLAAVDE